MLLDGYIRVSQVGGRHGARFISPSVQREEIEAWTSSHNAVLGEVFEELDESGGRADRPLLMQAIERVESGESDGMIVAKLDRFGRSVIDGLRSIARIEGAGRNFHQRPGRVRPEHANRQAGDADPVINRGVGVRAGAEELGRRAGAGDRAGGLHRSRVPAAIGTTRIDRLRDRTRAGRGDQGGL